MAKKGKMNRREKFDNSKVGVEVETDKLTKGIIYYTDNSLDEEFAKLFRQRLVNAAPGIPIVSVSQKPIDFGHNICVGEIGRSLHMMWKQILIFTTKHIT